MNLAWIMMLLFFPPATALKLLSLLLDPCDPPQAQPACAGILTAPLPPRALSPPAQRAAGAHCVWRDVLAAPLAGHLPLGLLAALSTQPATPGMREHLLDSPGAVLPTCLVR